MKLYRNEGTGEYFVDFSYGNGQGERFIAQDPDTAEHTDSVLSCG